MSESSERTLNERIAILMGWKVWLEKRGQYTHVVLQAPGDREPWMSTHRDYQRPQDYTPVTFADINRRKHIPPLPGVLPDFEHSVDALKPVEEKLHQLGWKLEMNSQPVTDEFFARWVHPTDRPGGWHGSEVEATARCEAAEAALIALSVDGIAK